MWTEVAFDGYERVDIELDPDDPDKLIDDWNLDLPKSTSSVPKTDASNLKESITTTPSPDPATGLNNEDSAQYPLLDDPSPPNNEAPKHDSAQQREKHSASPEQREPINDKASPQGRTSGHSDQSSPLKGTTNIKEDKSL